MSHISPSGISSDDVCERPTYASVIFLVELRSNNGGFHIVSDFRFTRKAAYGRWKGFPNMIMRWPSDFESQASHVEVRGGKVIIGAVIIEGKL